MANLIAFFIGFLALVLAIPAAVPFLGWANWGVIIIAAIGVMFGFVSRKNSGRNFCLVVMALCALRLMLGGGFI